MYSFWHFRFYADVRFHMLSPLATDIIFVVWKDKVTILSIEKRSVCTPVAVMLHKNVTAFVIWNKRWTNFSKFCASKTNPRCVNCCKMDPQIGDQLYSIFQEGYHRAASSGNTSVTGVGMNPPGSYNGYLPGINTPLLETEFPATQQANTFGPNNGWNHYNGESFLHYKTNFFNESQWKIWDKPRARSLVNSKLNKEVAFVDSFFISLVSSWLRFHVGIENAENPKLYDRFQSKKNSIADLLSLSRELQIAISHDSFYLAGLTYLFLFRKRSWLFCSYSWSQL